MQAGQDMIVPDDLGTADDLGGDDMRVLPDMGSDDCGAADLNGGSLVASGLEAYDLEDFTIEAWYRPEVGSLSGDHNLFGRWGVFGSTGSYALYINDGRAALGVSCDGTDFDSVDSEVDLAADTWVHLAATFSASTGRVQVFVDGVPRAPADSTTCRPNTLGATADLVLGYDDPSGGEPAEGLVDEARLSNVVRYTEAFTPERTFESDGDTVALYHFEDTSLPAADSSTNENVMSPSPDGAVALTTACRP